VDRMIGSDARRNVGTNGRPDSNSGGEYDGQADDEPGDLLRCRHVS
jgi:hypothetical protein